MLILDEFQRWASPTTAVFIHEARKLNVATVLATQTLASLSEENRAAALACGNLMVFRVSGLDAPILAKNFDHTPTPGEGIGYEPIRAPCANVVEHLVRRGHTNPVVAQFTTDYLMPLEALLRKLTGQERLFSFGCVMMMHPATVIDGQQLVNDALSQCMRTGRADGFIHPHALFILGGAADPSITYVFWSHLTRSLLSGGEFMGYEKSAHRFGQPGFRTEQGLTTFLASYTRPSVLDRLLHVTPQVPERVVAFVRLLRSLRAVMEVLAREPVLVDTGQYQPKYQQRTYADMEHQIANELSQMPNFHARVRFLSCGEQVLETRPLPPPVSGAEFTERIAGVQRRMWEGGVTRYYKEVEKAIRERQFWLLGQDEADEPPPGRF